MGDPRGVSTRLNGSLHRREYHVATPNSLWHIDGHHKLIRWRIIAHGRIDRFSRLPVYLNVSNSTSSSVVLDYFRAAVSQYGLPSRVQCDKGGENI